nr:MAG TPA: hypothetical protein [Caudoviricetes sp.]
MYRKNVEHLLLHFDSAKLQIFSVLKTIRQKISVLNNVKVCKLLVFK